MRIVKVRGDSMLPRYRHGDYLLVGRYLWRKPRPGDDIVFRHRDLGEVFKRIDRIEDDRINVVGLNSLSTDAASLGSLPAANARELERVLLHFPGH